MEYIYIKNKRIGADDPVFIIAEAGVNHNGDFNLAKKLVDVAVEAGADAVKFQTYKTEGVVSRLTDSAQYAKENMGREINQNELLKELELSYNEFIKLKKYCDKKNIIFLSTPHSFDAIDFLDELVPAFKFGSGDLTNIPALKHAAKKQKPLILGTGMATLDEVKFAVKKIKETGNDLIVALHCTTNYPCPIEEVNMNAMKTMQNKLDCYVGYSDHTVGTLVPIIAASLGAVIIEKHFTLDRKLKGPDHKASLEPTGLQRMVSSIRDVNIAMGIHEKKPTNKEMELIKKIRKSIVAKEYIKKGERINRDKLEIKRPGHGIQPYDLNKIIGKSARTDIKKDEIIDYKMVE